MKLSFTIQNTHFHCLTVASILILLRKNANADVLIIQSLKHFRILSIIKLIVNGLLVFAIFYAMMY